MPLHWFALLQSDLRISFQNRLILQRILCKLFHIEEAISSNSHTVVRKNKELKGLRGEQRAHDKELDAARADQAKAKGAVMQKEKTIKKAEKALDAKVGVFSIILRQLG